MGVTLSLTIVVSIVFLCIMAPDFIPMFVIGVFLWGLYAFAFSKVDIVPIDSQKEVPPISQNTHYNPPNSEENVSPYYDRPLSKRSRDKADLINHANMENEKNSLKESIEEQRRIIENQNSRLAQLEQKLTMSEKEKEAKTQLSLKKQAWEY